MIIPTDEELELVWKELGALEESIQNQIESKDRKIAALEVRLDALEKLIAEGVNHMPASPQRAV